MAQNTLLDFLQGASNSAASNVSAPIDGLNWLLRKAGMPVSDKPFLGSDWMAQKGLTVQPQNKMAGLLGESFGGVAPIVAAAKAPQIARGLLQAGENAIAPSVLRKESGMFVGPSSKTWDAQAASKAQQMAASGVDPRKVWSETGTWKGPDGMWRQEIPDNKAFYDPESLTDLKFGNEDFDYLKHTQPLGGVVEHKGLFKAYPDTNNIPVHFMPEARMRGAYGAYSGPADAITLTDKAKDQTSGALHEIQHAIQQREGFAGGGSSKMAFSDPQAWSIYKNLLGDMNNPLSMKDYAKQAWGTDSITQEVADAYKSYAKNIKKTITPEVDRAAQETAGKEYYRRLAGEAEARATQARIPLDAAQRRALFPEDSYDVPMNQLIIRGLLAP